MTKNQFLTEANKYIDRIEGNFADSTFKEKRRKLRKYSKIIYELYCQGIVSTCDPKRFKAEDVYNYQLPSTKEVL